ncbi:hypothetical protein [Aeromicrobium sp. Root344]|nr:hypothetical protein [Aeromicrobium sp. Root344]
MNHSKNTPVYVRPQLRSYGAITQVVQGKSGIGLDGSSGKIGKK